MGFLLGSIAIVMGIVGFYWLFSILKDLETTKYERDLWKAKWESQSYTLEKLSEMEPIMAMNEIKKMGKQNAKNI